MKHGTYKRTNVNIHASYVNERHTHLQHIPYNTWCALVRPCVVLTCTKNGLSCNPTDCRCPSFVRCTIVRDAKWRCSEMVPREKILQHETCSRRRRQTHQDSAQEGAHAARNMATTQETWRSACSTSHVCVTRCFDCASMVVCVGCRRSAHDDKMMLMRG